MAKLTRSEQIQLALRRLFEDEEVQGHLRTALQRGREAAARARTRRPSKAVEDKKLYAKVREAASSLTEAGRSLRAKPEPKRRGRKLVVLAALAGGAFLAFKKMRTPATESPAPPVSYDAPAPVAPTPPPVTAA